MLTFSNFRPLETFIGLEQRIAPGTNPRIPHVVSKSDSDHGTATTAHGTLGLTPAGTICRSDLSLSHYPLHIPLCAAFVLQCSTGLRHTFPPPSDPAACRCLL